MSCVFASPVHESGGCIFDDPSAIIEQIIIPPSAGGGGGGGPIQSWRQPLVDDRSKKVLRGMRDDEEVLLLTAIALAIREMF